ncbi:MAG: hypothetical protein OEW89_06210 [Gammaproteobacteria bacterium]|nr:hypothetical protein [Gammaproteobacteria bacterium]
MRLTLCVVDTLISHKTNLNQIVKPILLGLVLLGNTALCAISVAKEVSSETVNARVVNALGSGESPQSILLSLMRSGMTLKEAVGALLGSGVETELIVTVAIEVSQSQGLSLESALRIARDEGIQDATIIGILLSMGVEPGKVAVHMIAAGSNVKEVVRQLVFLTGPAGKIAIKNALASISEIDQRQVEHGLQEGLMAYEAGALITTAQDQDEPRDAVVSPN